MPGVIIVLTRGVITSNAGYCRHRGLLASRVIVGIVGCCWHCGCWHHGLLASRVIDIVDCWHRGLLLAPRVIVDIVGCCWRL